MKKEVNHNLDAVKENFLEEEFLFNHEEQNQNEKKKKEIKNLIISISTNNHPFIKYLLGWNYLREIDSSEPLTIPDSFRDFRQYENIMYRMISIEAVSDIYNRIKKIS